MCTSRYLSLLLAFCLSFMGSLTASIWIGGRPVSGPIDPELGPQYVGSQSRSGWISMYIPLENSGNNVPVYGVNGTGLSSTSYYNNFSGDVSGGMMSMWLYFDEIHGPVSEADLKLEFKDLDLRGVNDPNSATLQLIESVELFDTAGQSFGEVDDIDDNLSGYTISGNYNRQNIMVDLLGIGMEVNEGFTMRLKFSTDVYYANRGWLTNTREKIRPSLHVVAEVPEPGTYLLLGSMLLLCSMIRQRRAAMQAQLGR